MNLTRMFTLFLGLLLVVMLAGCGKDDCASCPTQTTPLAYAKGGVVVAPNTILEYFEVHGHGAVVPTLDSVRIGDSLVNRDSLIFSSHMLFADAYWEAYFSEDGDPSSFMYEAGDTAVIKVWGEGRSSTCRVKLLNPRDAPVHVTSPASLTDTVELGTSYTIYWNRVEHADYYAVGFAWVDHSSNYSVDFLYTVDTSFIVTGDMVPDSVDYCQVAITPFNGPDPRTERSNWTGNLLDGIVYSPGVFETVTVDFSLPLGPPQPAVSSQFEGEPPAWNAHEIVGKMYEKFGQ